MLHNQFDYVAPKASILSTENFMSDDTKDEQMIFNDICRFFLLLSGAAFWLLISMFVFLPSACHILVIFFSPSLWGVVFCQAVRFILSWQI